jgi:hypothetical protein
LLLLLLADESAGRAGGRGNNGKAGHQAHVFLMDESDPQSRVA